MIELMRSTETKASGYIRPARHTKKSHSAQTVRLARRLYRTGIGYAKVAAIVGAGESTVRDWVKRYTRVIL